MKLLILLFLSHCYFSFIQCYTKIPIQVIHLKSSEQLANKQENFINENGLIQNLELKNGLIGNIAIGTPPQGVFQVLIDIDSALTWVLSSKCKPEVCKNHTLFHEQSSKTYKGESGFHIIKDEGENLMGLKAHDQIQIGSIIVKDQSFALVNDYKTERIYDGVLGLLFNNKDESIIKSMMDQNLLKSNIFSLYLNSTGKDNYENITGELILGGWNDLRFDPNNIEYTRTSLTITDTNKYQFKIDYIYSVRHTNGVWCKTGCKAVINIKSKLIVGPENEINAIFQYIGAMKTYKGVGIVRCNQIHQLPSVKFRINERDYVLESKDYILQMPINKMCMVTFYPATNSNDPWQLGIPFLSKFYTIINVGTKEIAFPPLSLD